MSHIPYYGEDWDVPAPPRKERPADRTPTPAPSKPRNLTHAWDREGVRGAFYL